MYKMSLLSQFYHKSITSRYLSQWYRIPKTDPGIKLRKKILNSNEELEETEFDELETDFMDVHKTHKEHVRETEALRELEKFHIVKQKYFKERNINFLTWRDKEQIKYLHSSDPEEWTIEKLSEGFPALPNDIKKVLKAKWTIQPTRITNHDKSVQKNWEDFKSGKIQNVSKELVDHLNKFTNRALNYKTPEPPESMIESRNVVVANMKPIGTEFSDIITSYNELKSKNEYKVSDENSVVNIKCEIINNMKKNDSSLQLSKKIKQQSVTLNQLQNALENRLNDGEHLSEEEKLLVTNLKQPPQELKPIELDQSNLEKIMKNKYDYKKGTSLMKKNENDYNHLIYPQRIRIPENQRKKGYTYKLNDCYYDDDGEFLYRVPGMY